MTLFYLGMFAASLLLSFLFTRSVRDRASERGWVAVPSADRHLHSRPLPRLGGVAILAAFLATVCTGLLLLWFYGQLGTEFAWPRIITILFPALLVFLLGIYDDVHPVGPYFKFSVQAIAATILFAGGLRILDLPVLFAHHFSWFVSLPLTILWVLAITNAFNLIDGLDGLAAGSALFSTVVVFVVSLLSNSPLVSVMTIALAGAILGFLRFNFNPATIFLGDCGSLFIGFLLSALALHGAQKAPTTIAVAIPVVSFGLPILETALSVLRRFIGGRPVFTADREHIHHKLLQRGLSHRQVVVVLYAVSAFFALLSLFLLWPTGSTLGLVLAVLGTGIWVGVQHLGYLEFGELRRVALRTMEQRHIFINNLAIRRATEELKVVRSREQLSHVLTAAFENNDFDAFDLRTEAASPAGFDEFLDPEELTGKHFRWSRAHFPRDLVSAWTLTLDLITANNQRRGSLTLYRMYSQRDLQLDVNLLTSIFPVALAEALDRVNESTVEVLPRTNDSPTLLAAHAG